MRRVRVGDATSDHESAQSRLRGDVLARVYAAYLHGLGVLAPRFAGRVLGEVGGSSSARPQGDIRARHAGAVGNHAESHQSREQAAADAVSEDRFQTRRDNHRAQE